MNALGSWLWLSQAYINSGEGDLDCVVRGMGEMEFLFTETFYAGMREQVGNDSSLWGVLPSSILLRACARSTSSVLPKKNTVWVRFT